MQDPQEQQPSSPSEIRPEVPSPAFSPSDPQKRSSETQRRDIVIFPNRGPILWLCVLLAFVTLVLIGLMAALFVPVFTGAIPVDAEELPLMVVMGGLCFAVIAFVGWQTWSMSSLLSPPTKPVLIITASGIRVQKMPMQSGFFIPWDQIERIAPSSYESASLGMRSPRYTYLCLVPKQPEQFLAQFPLLERVNRRLNARTFGAPLYCPQVYMQRSVQSVLSQIATDYQAELRAHDIRLQE